VIAPVHRRLLRASGAARWHLAAAVASGAATAAAVIAQAVLLGRVVAALVGGAPPADVRGEIIGLALASVARGALGWGQAMSAHVAATRVMSALRARLVGHVLRARPAAGEAGRAGEIATDAVQGVDALETYFGRYVPEAVLALLVPPAVILWVLPLDPASAAIMALTLPVAVVFLALVGMAAAAASRARMDALRALGGRFVEVVRGLPTLRAHGRAAHQAQVLGDIGERLRRETMGTLRVAFLSALVLELAASLGVALVAVAIGLRLAGGGMTLEAGLTVLVLAPELYAPLRRVGANHHAAADGLAAAERIHAVLDLPPALTPAARPAALPDPATAPLALEGVSVRHEGRDRPALDGVDLAIPPGERLALVGPSGAGKSTLIALLARLADPDDGRVSCGGADLRDGDGDAWRRRVAWVPQRPSLLAASVAENVRMGDPAASDARVWAALEAANAAALVRALPDGLATRIGEGGRRLSTGEVRRVALARAFVRDPSLVLLDEPAAGLDPASAALVEEAIARLCHGRTAVVATHRLAITAGADRVVVLQEGRVAEEGAPAALAPDGPFAALRRDEVAVAA
jgi:ATP-binding cassette subfamily C protein CydD